MKRRKNKNKVIYGSQKAKEYNAVSREIESLFIDWLDFAELSQAEFGERLKKEPHMIKESINADGDMEINIYAGNEKVIAPLVFLSGSGDSSDNFLVNALLLLFYAATKYNNKSFENAVKAFSERMAKERKIM